MAPRGLQLATVRPIFTRTAQIKSQLVIVNVIDQPANHRSSLVLCRATEMDVTMIGLQNAGKSSLLRVLAVRLFSLFVSFLFHLWNSTHIATTGRRIHNRVSPHSSQSECARDSGH
jgi:50S ribosomal subunit-associated GTPase HflX